MSMILRARMLAALLVGPWIAAPAWAENAASAWARNDHAAVRLVAALGATGGGESVALGLEFDLRPGWKIYWRMPGEGGLPPRLDWSASRNLGQVAIAWPAPIRFTTFGLDTHGYEGHVVLPLTATLLDRAAPVQALAKLDYLLCEKICIPYDATLRLDLPAGPATSSAHAHTIARFAARVPSRQGGPAASAQGLVIERAEYSAGASPLLIVTARSESPMGAPDLFVEAAGDVSFGRPEVSYLDARRVAVLRLPVDAPARAVLTGAAATLTLVDGARAVEAALSIAAGPPPADDGGLLLSLALAVLGGLILNLMPCVLPVLSLKLMGIVRRDRRTRAELRASFIATSAGILTAFLALAAGLIALKSLGHAVGWGIQFQSPWFLGAMALLLSVFAVNLWGWFTIPLPAALGGKLARWDEAGAARSGHGGAFTTGLFATLLATPCSAPFLGTAIGFALARGPAEIVGIFTAVAIGLALPYLLVAALPGLATYVPRSGRWMIHLRKALAVGLAASAAWLLAVLWSQLAPRAEDARGGAIAWREFSREAIDLALARGETVFVDVTADWCITCQVNKRAVIEREPVRARLNAPGVIAMRADWTRPDPRIAAYLAGFGRYGIPFNAVYGPARPGGIALGEILTSDAVLEALARAHGAPRPNSL
jgi:suppressor for copper-sensitivity B